ncbi:MAG: hypothetical protein EB127_13130 [Alphaproteobacteria bacterium]|nr:hypothetical protein [Alphaproteobacteria bacterium]
MSTHQRPSNQRSSNPRSSNPNLTKPRFLKPNNEERNWIRTIPDSYTDILRAPAVTYKPQRDDPRIKSNKYVAYARPYLGKQGLLIIGKGYRPILIDESQPDKVNVLVMRLDREALQGTWIFAISIYESEGLIQLEDCIVRDGTQLRSTTGFKDRFALVQKFFYQIFYNDPKFQLNWQIQISEVDPLIQIRNAISRISGGNLCLMPENPQFRLLKIIPRPVEDIPITTGPGSFTCLPIEGKPDVYDLVGSDGKNVGRGAVQTLSISQALQYKKSTGEVMRVMAEWNEEFDSYVIISVI